MDCEFEINALKVRVTELENDLESVVDYCQTAHETFLQIFKDIENLASNHEGLVMNWGTFVMPSIRALQERRTGKSNNPTEQELKSIYNIKE